MDRQNLNTVFKQKNIDCVEKDQQHEGMTALHRKAWIPGVIRATN